MAGEFDDLFKSGASVWFKIGGAALAAALIGIIGLARNTRRGTTTFDGPATPAIIVLVLTIAGAGVGAMLAMKDIVQERQANGLPVSWPMRLVFNFGIASALFFWIPVLFVGITLVLMLFF